MNPIQKVSIYYDTLTSKEKETCNLVLKSPHVVIDNPIADAAKIFQVSPSSIVRLSKKLGYKGYSELQYALENFFNKTESVDTNSIINKVTKAFSNQFDEIHRFFTEEDILKLIELMKTKKIFTAGTGNSAFVAQQMIYAIYDYDWGECLNTEEKIAFYANYANPDDVLILFSSSANHHWYFNELKTIYKRGTHVVLITTNVNTPWRPYCELVIAMPPAPIIVLDDTKKIHNLENRTMLYFLIDIISAYYIASL